MRRNVGLSSLSRDTERLASFNALSTDISRAQLDVLSAQLATFQTALRTFATKHRAKIARDPTFRAQFSAMCAQLGVDPLGGGAQRGGSWASLLGIGDWTYALAVQVVDVCLVRRERTGGLVDLDEVIAAVGRLRGGGAADQVTEADVTSALRALEPLGAGYAIVTLPGSGRRMVRCVPAEFDRDALVVLECCASARHRAPKTTQADLLAFMRAAAWTADRAKAALDKALLVDGLVWIDEQAEEPEYWSPSLLNLA